ncbi:MAG: hypothetical protein OXI77_08525 [Chloroflexota bacterium]|nr:hypothetical protein [Chloroflexota bacterium]MDE2910723.1 hypothetical protein [Chloroflexota bacterium]
MMILAGRATTADQAAIVMAAGDEVADGEVKLLDFHCCSLFFIEKGRNLNIGDLSIKSFAWLQWNTYIHANSSVQSFANS